MENQNNRLVKYYGEQDLKNFLTNAEEKVVLTKRSHWVTLLAKILAITIVSFILLFFSFFLFAILTLPVKLFVSSVILISILELTLISKLIVDWYCHFYILTNKKLLDVSYSPLFSETAYEVPINQAACSRIVVKKNQILSSFFPIGSINLIFQGKDYTQEFKFSKIGNPEETSLFLSEYFGIIKDKNIRPFWERAREKMQPFTFVDSVFPKTLIRI